jgi:flagellar biosynthesis protein FlhA
MAAGMLVTRAAARNNLGKELAKQLLFYPRAMALLSVMLMVLSLIPGLPTLPFVVLAGFTGVVAWRLHRRKTASPVTVPQAGGKSPAAQDGTTASAPAKEKLESLLHLDALQIELGYALVGLADKRKGGDLLDRVTGLRRTFATEMGVVIPPIRLGDNLQLGANDYRFILKGNAVAQGQLMPGYWLAMNATNSKTQLKGVPTLEPVFQLPATWITDPERKNAEVSGYTVVDAASVLVTHLSETIKRHAQEILSRQDVQLLLDTLKQTHPTVVNELVPGLLSVGQVQRILQNLLAEGISIRNLAGILEKVGDHATLTKNPDELSEHARKALGGQLIRPFQGDSGALQAITLDPKLEQQIANGIRHTPNEVTLMLDSGLARHVVNCLTKEIQKMLSIGLPPLVLCAPQIRLAFRRFFETTFADLNVLAYTEVPSRVTIRSAAIVPCPE